LQKQKKLFSPLFFKAGGTFAFVFYVFAAFRFVSGFSGLWM